MSPCLLVAITVPLRERFGSVLPTTVACWSGTGSGQMQQLNAFVRNRHLCHCLCVIRRLVRRQEESRAQRGQMKQLKGLMHGLVNVTGDPAKQQLDAIRNARELAFLITDLQDSTAMASANPAAFRKVQDIHDTVGLPNKLFV